MKKTGRVVIVYEAPRTGGFGAEVAAVIAERAIEYLEAPIGRVTGYDVVTPGFGRENGYLPSAERIRRVIEETVDFE